MLIVPLVFFLMGLSRLVTAHDHGLEPMLAWLAAAILFAALALLRGPQLLAVDRDNGTVTRPGSWSGLIRNITVFALQYTVAVIAAIDPHDATTAAIIGRAISGGTTGYFLGRTVALLRQYFRQRRADAAT